MNSQESDPPYDWNSTDPLAQEWTDTAHRLLTEKKIVARIVPKQSIYTAHFDGPCPRCGDTLSQRILHSAVGFASKVSDLENNTVPKLTTDVVFECDCGEEHHGRPEGITTGCGIAFTLRVSTEPQ